jgi:CHASE2 domain-containing sensor protein
LRLRLKSSPKTLAVVIASVLATAAGIGSYAAEAWPGVEKETLDLRFRLRGASRPSDVVVVAIDEKTFSELGLQWPFPRSLHGDVIRRLHADGARTIAYDIQFTEPSVPQQDLALYNAIAAAGHVVLATTEVDAEGHTDVLGGEANLARAHAVAAASNLPADPGGVIRRYHYTQLGLKSFAVAVAQVAGHPISPSRFGAGGAEIDFAGPPGSIRTVSFSDVLRGRIPASTFAGKIVVVGVSAPTLQDVHQTSTTTANPMAGPEIQANAIWTALHGNPLQPSPAWLDLLAIVLLAVLAPLASLRLRVSLAAVLALLAAIVYGVLAQLAFDSGTILDVSYPLAAGALGMVGMVAANYVGALVERDGFSRRLTESQLELIQRLAHAVEFRDTETGEHIQRYGPGAPKVERSERAKRRAGRFHAAPPMGAVPSPTDASRACRSARAAAPSARRDARRRRSAADRRCRARARSASVPARRRRTRRDAGRAAGARAPAGSRDPVAPRRSRM